LSPGPLVVGIGSAHGTSAAGRYGSPPGISSGDFFEAVAAAVADPPLVPSVGVQAGSGLQGTHFISVKTTSTT